MGGLYRRLALDSQFGESLLRRGCLAGDYREYQSNTRPVGIQGDYLKSVLDREHEKACL